MKNLNFKNKYGPALSKANGFTLVEFMVVIGIFLVFSSLILVRYSGLKSSISIGNLAQDIAISIRKVQLYSVGVKGINSSSGEIFPPGYGASFNPSDSKSYTLFVDMPVTTSGPGNKTYDAGSSGSGCGASNVSNANECLEIITIKSNDMINKLYLDGSVCSSNLDIVFMRPNLMASIKCGATVGKKGTIEIKSNTGKLKKINISTAGNINVE